MLPQRNQFGGDDLKIASPKDGLEGSDSVANFCKHLVSTFFCIRELLGIFLSLRLLHYLPSLLLVGCLFLKRNQANA